MRTTVKILLLIAILISQACVKYNPPKRPQHKQKYDKQLEEMNKKLVVIYQNAIKEYIKKRGWNMDSTATGIWYGIYKGDTTAYKPKDGDQVTVAYTLELINGKTCYNYDPAHAITFTVNHSEVLIGLNDVIQYIPEGCSAHVIIPPYFAYGIPGDGKCVPRNAIVVLDLHLLNVQKAKSNQSH